ncbi:MAG: LrgB family protein [Caulobacteraceae bacterium]|nr:LrgB family protein [Caulobacteraceae bacterium]
MPWNEPVGPILVWSAATIALYALAKTICRRWSQWWLTPLTLTPALLIALMLALHASYGDYSRGVRWLAALLGPATVAFAIPIYRQRALILRRWPVLAIGVVAGSATAMTTAWGLASVLGLDGALRLSLLPRSMSTPFAMTVSGDIGGAPDLTAFFVIVTGVFGAALGEVLLQWLPVRSAMARGALFGMGAHAVGVAKAHQIGGEEGSIAGVILVLVGLVNVLAAPLLALWLR